MEPNELAALKPVNFFQLQLDCRKLPSAGKKMNGEFRISERNLDEYSLPTTGFLTKDLVFAEVALGWSIEGIEAYIKVGCPFIKACYPQVASGDSVELFIDTRDIKTSGYNTRFCHHFFFFPEALEGKRAGELTRFRSEDAHDLCDPDELKVKAALKKDQYTLQAYIPASCLHGYDPEQYQYLGFTYRINHGGRSQHFSVVSDEFRLEQQPSLWGSLKLIK